MISLLRLCRFGRRDLLPEVELSVPHTWVFFALITELQPLGGLSKMIWPLGIVTARRQSLPIDPSLSFCQRVRELKSGIVNLPMWRRLQKFPVTSYWQLRSNKS
jgi:hypothetical protein